ncbi:chromosomal replication initiator protein DnaA [Aquella oligotrophica]|uniref:Chromosomal replication initiator protein DnaA n=1 Tax=Aquella oligotrophica TaxID=2067065 RepID=A0A2I7N3Y6_9NEIS|nr:chromosomal replication initiator protein DnaA [Aquella oligotrophica]AUR50935.1 chromosomal replication initiator protein DnaA [Aquella oligotrophica]
MTEFEIVWQQCVMLIKEQGIISDAEYNTWFRNLIPRANNSKMEVVAGNRLIHDFINKKYWAKVSSILQELNNGTEVDFIVDKPVAAKITQEIGNSSNLLVKAEPVLEIESVAISRSKNSIKPKVEKEVLTQLHQSTKLNKDFTFDSLIRGNSNQLAYAIGMHITQDPGNRNHNPLFVYGGVGLGKTHLMQAIGNEIYRKNPNAKIRYLHANDYIQDVVKASMRQGFDELKRYYNGLDLLLMDDIQFIAGDKTKTQEEFFYTFNNLLDKGKQVIMTCDTFPKNINNLNERLISRFASGLTVEIQPPELEMRVAILKNKALRSNIDLDDEVAFFIGQNIKSNVRELEGALNKVIYHAKFSRKGLSIAIAKEALIDIIASEVRTVSIDDIQKVVCDFYKIKISDLLSSKRTQLIARPRQIAMTLSKELTQHSLPAIGEAFGGRDHTTVLHAQKTISQLREKDEKIEREYKLLIQMLQN